MPVTTSNRKKELARIRTNIWRAKMRGDDEFVTALEKKRAQLKKK